MSCQLSTAIRAPQVLPLLAARMSEQRRLSCCLLGWTGASATMTCACWIRTAVSWSPAGSPMVWGGRAAWAGGYPCRGPGAGRGGIETDRALLVGALLAAGYQVYAVNPHAVS